MIVGVDVSSRRVDLAWLEDGKPCRWHQELPKGHLIDRLRAIHILWPDWMGSYNVDACVTDVAIEMPFGQSRKSVAALMSVVGIVTRQAPPWARVAWPSAAEVRAAIGSRNNKQDAHQRLARIAIDNGWSSYFWDDDGKATLDEHECDALVTCIGWTRILAQQEAA